MNQSPEPAGHSGGISTLAAELVVACILFAIGALVVYDSYRLGSRWAGDGPEAGYFPFYIGLIICISCVATLVFAVRGRATAGRKLFVGWQALRQVLSVIIPAAFFVLGIQIIGLYLASAVYIAGFMMWLGEYGWLRSAVLGFVVSALAFLTFEVWFQVPLYKGMLDPLAFLGY
ncbi:MAG TPA: tripartite tricarboxylate transporter TctB family protein [Burkholderiales bacterium]|nr:tripartite tricarboxylate transporter TctB family protein [Burkholderiales bacterium]